MLIADMEALVVDIEGVTVGRFALSAARDAPSMTGSLRGCLSICRSWSSRPIFDMRLAGSR